MRHVNSTTQRARVNAAEPPLPQAAGADVGLTDAPRSPPRCGHFLPPRPGGGRQGRAGHRHGESSGSSGGGRRPWLRGADDLEHVDGSAKLSVQVHTHAHKSIRTHFDLARSRVSHSQHEHLLVAGTPGTCGGAGAEGGDPAGRTALIRTRTGSGGAAGVGDGGRAAGTAWRDDDGVLCVTVEAWRSGGDGPATPATHVTLVPATVLSRL